MHQAQVAHQDGLPEGAPNDGKEMGWKAGALIGAVTTGGGDARGAVDGVEVGAGTGVGEDWPDLSRDV